MHDVPPIDRADFTRVFLPDELDLDRFAAALRLLLKERRSHRISVESDLRFDAAEVTHVVRPN